MNEKTNSHLRHDLLLSLIAQYSVWNEVTSHNPLRGNDGHKISTLYHSQSGVLQTIV